MPTPMPDALGSLRKIDNRFEEIVGVYAERSRSTRTYTPYGTVYDSAGTGASQYGFSGELLRQEHPECKRTDPSELIYLRARYYHPYPGGFIN